MNLEYTRNKNFPVIEKTTNPRKVRAKTMFKLGLEPKHYKKGVYAIPSQTDPRRAYMVFEKGGRWYCSCPDRLHRKVKCKHIFLFQMWTEMKQALLEHSEVETPKEIPTNENTIFCKHCNSIEVIKNGTRKNKITVKTRYLCKSCNKTFTLEEREVFGHMKFTPETITLCLDLYFKGFSLRKVQEHLQQFHNTKLNYSTVSLWIKKYTQIINEYIKTLDPDVGDTWHTDEMMVKNGGDWSWVWNVIDSETRFLLASLVSKRRSVVEARRVFRTAKEQAKGRPSEMVTDGLWSYKMAFKKEFYAKRGTKPRLTHKAGVNKPDNNNKVERLNGTVREREKVMRGMKDEKTAQELIEGFKNYYNFIRPHQALNGKTPAEMAGLDLELGQNKWLGLIEKASDTS